MSLQKIGGGYYYVEGPNGVEDEDWFIENFDGKEKVVTYAREWY